jgi:hypothetical protein
MAGEQRKATRMFDGLRNVRARCAYWEKRIALEPKVMRRRELARMAAAEIVRLVIQFSSSVLTMTALHELVNRFMVETELRQHGVALPTTASRQKKHA